MRRSIAASAQFKPPRMLNTSVSVPPAEVEEKEDGEDDDGHDCLQNAGDSKKVKLTSALAVDPGPDSDDDVCSDNTGVADELASYEDVVSTNNAASQGSYRSYVTLEEPQEASPATLSPSESSQSSGGSVPEPTPVQLSLSTIIPPYRMTPKVSNAYRVPIIIDPNKNALPLSTVQRENADTIESLVAQKEQLEAEIRVFEDKGNSADDLDEYMELLHRYNNAKDIAQCLMGELAVRNGITLREVAAKMGAPVEDE